MEEMDKKIVILLATYNGVRFLSEQFDSLLRQTFQDFTVIIRDDGSTDGTIEIIENYALRYPRKFFILKDDVLHRGARESFMYLLENVIADYYLFCDQDDVWLPSKLELSLNKIKETERLNPELPVMIHTDLRIVDENLNTLYDSLWQWAGFDVDLNKQFNYAVMGNVFTGCTMIINRKARDFALPIHPKSSMHDEWIGLVISKYGIVDNLKAQTILYRQHGKNVCSIGDQKDFSKQKFKFSILYQWYYDNYELLSYLKYGSVVKAIYYKTIYLIKRRFFNA